MKEITVPELSGIKDGLGQILPPTLDALPQVSFDVRLGKKYDYLDVDYEQLRLRAEQVGIPKNEISNLDITIFKPRLFPALGSYSRKTKLIDSRLYRKHVNQTTTHEMKHHSDDLEGKLAPNFLVVIGNISIYTQLLTTPILAISLATEPYSDLMIDICNHTLNPNLYAGIGTLALYWLRKDERRARAAAKAHKNDEPIITFRRK